MELDIKLILDYIIVPMFLWCIYADRKITRLEATQITKDELQKIHERLDLIYLGSCGKA